MAIAELVAERSTCVRRQVGAVIVKDRKILTTGYNGAPSRIKHCSDIGCLRKELNIPAGERHEICRGTHAEQNAIIQAATFGVDISDGTVYSTHQPCFICTKMLINSKVSKIIYKKEYPDQLAIDMLNEAKITFVKI